MRIFVEFIPEGKRISLDVASTDKISRVKAKIKENEGIPIERQALYFDTRLLFDSDILEHCGIENDDTLCLVRDEDDQGNDHNDGPPPNMDISLFLGAELVRVDDHHHHHRGTRPVRGLRAAAPVVSMPPPLMIRAPIPGGSGGHCAVM